MSPSAGSRPRAIAALLGATLLVASLLPCPTPADGEARVAAAHGHASHAGHLEAEDGAGHADCGHPVPTLRAACSCGCADTPGADASLARLPVSLLAAATVVSAGPGPLAAPADRGAPPDSPHEPIDHVPLRRA
jgi:hypothetical protein